MVLCCLLISLRVYKWDNKHLCTHAHFTLGKTYRLFLSSLTVYACARTIDVRLALYQCIISERCIYHHTNRNYHNIVRATHTHAQCLKN